VVEQTGNIGVCCSLLKNRPERFRPLFVCTGDKALLGEIIDFVLDLSSNNDKAKPTERPQQKATGSLFLREATDHGRRPDKVEATKWRYSQRAY